MTKLLLLSLLNLVVGSVMLGVLLFLSAGTLDYWQAWVFIVVFSAAANGIGIYLSIKDPALLERRKNLTPAAPASLAQKIMGVLILVGVLALLVVPALDHRFGWSSMPGFVAVFGDVLMLLSFVAFYYVFRENSYGGSTIEVFEGQQVISTGPYAIVRHPMYLGVVIMCVGAVLALGSWWTLLVIVLMEMPVLAWRILDEEQVLAKDLPGYTDYMHKVRYRLVPHVW
jgi:protein-S-isoprenylcysteine O-methyltransferase Ste14